MAFHDSVACEASTRGLILDVLAKMAGITEPAFDLVRQRGLLQWVNSHATQSYHNFAATATSNPQKSEDKLLWVALKAITTMGKAVTGVKKALPVALNNECAVLAKRFLSVKRDRKMDSELALELAQTVSLVLSQWTHDFSVITREDLLNFQRSLDPKSERYEEVLNILVVLNV